MSHQIAAIGDFNAITNSPVGQRGAAADRPDRQTRSRPMNCGHALTNDHLRLVAARARADDLHTNHRDSWLSRSRQKLGGCSTCAVGADLDGGRAAPEAGEWAIDHFIANDPTTDWLAVGPRDDGR